MKENYESIVGHHYQVEVTAGIDGEMADVFKKFNVEPRKYVHITEGDVDWDETREIKIPLDTFKEIAKDVNRD